MKINFSLANTAVARWNPAIKASSGLNLLGVIGDDNRLSHVMQYLEDADGADVDVNINSPGGSMFEGLAMYTAFREYSGHVTINVLGVAASAASIIAMAGDTVNVAKSGFLMIHNSWTLVAGNRHNLTEIAAQLAPFDAAMADIYAEKSGESVADIAAAMDAETWINGEEAVKMGFADKAAADEAQPDEESPENARAEIDLILAKSGVSRSERRRLLASYRSTQNAVSDDTQNAVKDLSDALENLKTLFKS